MKGQFDLWIGGDILKWNEIPKFREFGIANSLNFGFVSYVNFINEQIKNYNLNMNPEFQRGHVWTIDQQEKYIEFILRGGKQEEISIIIGTGKQMNTFVWMDYNVQQHL